MYTLVKVDPKQDDYLQLKPSIVFKKELQRKLVPKHYISTNKTSPIM